MEQLGNTLTVQSNSVMESTHKNNGIMQKIHSNEYTTGYDQLLDSSGDEGEQYFGYGVFKDAGVTTADGVVYNSATGLTTPVFAGVMARQDAIANGGYPALYNKVSSFNKGLRCIQGYLNYGLLDTIASTASSRAYVTLSAAILQYVFAIRLSDGAPCIGTVSDVNAAIVAGTHVVAGRVINYLPDSKMAVISILPGISILETSLSSANDIISFAFLQEDNGNLTADYTATITDTDIAVTVPSETDVTDLVASFLTNGKVVAVGTVVQVSGTTENDFSSAVAYTVVAEDGTTQTYTVTVTVSA